MESKGLRDRRLPQKAWQLLENRNNFCRGGLAKDEDYNLVHPLDYKAAKWTALGALIYCYNEPSAELVKLASLCWWGKEPRKYWLVLADWWSAHEDPYIVWARLRKLDI